MANKSNPALSLAQIQHLISCIYDAALDEDKWEDVLIALAATLHAEQGILRVLDSRSMNIHGVHTLNKDPTWTQAYIDHYVQQDPWLNIFLEPKNTRLDCTHHLMSDKQYEAMEYYFDFVKPQDMHFGIGGLININDSASCYMTFQRGKKRGGFEQQYLDTLISLAPHIQKAVLINDKMRHAQLENNLLKDTLNKINNPLLLVNSRGKILYINSIAEQLISQQANVSIVNNFLVIYSNEENKKLQQLIHQATSADNKTSLKQGGAMCYQQVDSNSYLSIMVSPVNPDRINIDGPAEKMAIVLLNTNHCQTSLNAELLKGLYNFTTAESRLVLHLCKGLTLDEISQQLFVTKNTLKSQLRSCFIKTGVFRQSELVNLVNTGPASVFKL